jgi:hypothetical protein
VLPSSPPPTRAAVGLVLANEPRRGASGPAAVIEKFVIPPGAETHYVGTE